MSGRIGSGRTSTPQQVQLISSRKQGISGFFAGLISSVATYPLDLLKTRFQSSHYNHYSSIVQGWRQVITIHGIRGLYGGIHASLIGSSIAWGTYFYIYAEMKDIIRKNQNQENASLLPQEHLLSSFAAGAITQVISNPIWVVKTNSQLNHTR